ncbi:hypothetical protein IAQ61_007583 [Plenodomus lingam]|uniref:Predicted protein n=1 Tax=Leptosphaeria maculans (strain JN3 / isolate v23.1.3 / race Av1-4-5-6-7-8) TaxID=985895 RepID=E5A5A4_LEPMJ|nr:predicted protein [Plenodomus lingam JN3]KAH9866992.1 hypothetical protein IAQ61_007583 [Plenodomus lingam]CBX98802.1 predicted protein [Plenodomus lingam JN3]
MKSVRAWDGAHGDYRFRFGHQRHAQRSFYALGKMPAYTWQGELCIRTNKESRTHPVGQVRLREMSLE